MKSSFVIFLLLCGMSVAQIRQYVYIPTPMNWSSAQSYCKKKYVDLATITTDEENKILINAAAAVRISRYWIGLNRTEPGLNVWQWSDGEPPNFFKWATGQPDNFDGNEACVMVFTWTGWNDNDCVVELSFFCSWGFVLVKDNKTWEEALDYCRIKYTGLATLIAPEQLTLAKNNLTQTQTVSVWTGLRFVNGQWVSVNRRVLSSLVSLTSCPAPRYRCGALNTDTNILENRDCSEKLNFLCY